jgi:hypothetical protein
MYRNVYDAPSACAAMALSGHLSQAEWEQHVADVARLGDARVLGEKRLALLLVLGAGLRPPQAHHGRELVRLLEQPERNGFVALVSRNRVVRAAAKALSWSRRGAGTLGVFAALEPALAWLERQRGDIDALREAARRLELEWL